MNNEWEEEVKRMLDSEDYKILIPFITSLIASERADWLRSEIEKLEGMKRYDPILHTVTVPDGDNPTSEQWANKGHNQALTSIITRYKEELKVLESESV